MKAEQSQDVAMPEGVKAAIRFRQGEIAALNNALTAYIQGVMDAMGLKGEFTVNSNSGMFSPVVKSDGK